MNIPSEYAKDVMEDLSAVYLSGEASRGTLAVVEQYANEHPEFQARLRSAQTPLLREAKFLAPDRAAQVLRHTRQFIGLRSLFTGMGIAFTLLPLSCVFDNNGFRFLFLYSQPGLVTSFGSIAVASWVARWVMNRAIQKVGL